MLRAIAERVFVVRRKQIPALCVGSAGIGTLEDHPELAPLFGCSPHTLAARPAARVSGSRSASQVAVSIRSTGAVIQRVSVVEGVWMPLARHDRSGAIMTYRPRIVGPTLGLTRP